MKSLQGYLLVAAPRLPDVNFYRSVVLIVHHDEQGAFGVVLNRVTEQTVSEYWEEAGEDPCDNLQFVHLGGPVRGPLIVLHCKPEFSESEVFPGLYFATHKELLNEIVRAPDTPFRIFNGYSGWAPGQLESELQQGGWMTMRASQEYIFGDVNQLWKHATQEIGQQIIEPLLQEQLIPDDPSWN